MGIWYRQGTASCANGSTSVTGSLTGWNNQVKAGDELRFLGDTDSYEIAEDADTNTSLTLVRAYEGESKENAPYEIIPLSVRRENVPELWYRVDSLLSRLATLVRTTGKPADSFGANDTLAIDKAALLMYLKTDGHWDDGTSLGGPGYGGISSDEQTIEREPKTWTIPAGFAWVAGSRVRAIAVGSSPLAWMEGNITEYADGSISIDVDAEQGEGTYSDWVFTLVGEKGAQGDPGDDGDDGNNGWSPILASITDGDRNVLKVSDWTGGEGTKPGANKYLGTSGLVTDIADAVDIRGSQGEKGDTGPASMVWKGDYDDLTAYVLNDVVAFEGSTWRCIAPTTNHTPPSVEDGANTYWTLVAAKGDKGDQGDPGTPGTDGTDGTNFSPDAQGVFADRSTYDGEDEGFVFLSTDGDGAGGTSAVLFFKEQVSPPVWSDPVTFQGPVGPVGINWRGDYADEIEFNQNDGVYDQGGSWRAKQATVGNPPPTLPDTENDYWKLLARPGNDSATSYNDLTDKPTLGTAAAEDVEAFATAAQGALADSALQSTDVAPTIHAATGKSTPVDADELALVDSAASNVLKKLTWANVKATLTTYFDTLYQPVASALTSWGSVTRASGFDTFAATPSSANLRALLTDEVGTGVAYFVGGALGTPASGSLDNCTTNTGSARSNATQLASEAYADAQVDASTLINTQTASYTAVIADKGYTVEMNVASANTFTIPPNSSVAFPVGTYINVSQIGAGQTTLTPGSGVTINGRNGLKLAGQHAMATLYKRATDTWQAGGDLTS